jgi:uncharacterized membrane protein YbhN (UPF0104 family)
LKALVAALRASPRTRRWLAAAVTVAAFAYLFIRVDRHALLQAFLRVSLAAWLTAFGLTVAAVSCGLVRWWLLFHAFGAARPPRLGQLAEHYMAGLFYNTYLPGGLSGDVVRGLATQQAFEPGSAGAFATVIVERALGLAALLGLVASTMLSHALPGSAHQRLLVLGACAIGLIGLVALTQLRRMLSFLPPALRSVAERVPAPHAWGPLWLALLLSFGSQLAPALCGHVLLHSMYSRITLQNSLVIVPLATASAFFPFSISGAGVRESVFVALYASVGVPDQDAFAASLSLWGVQALLAGLCGIYVLLRSTPLTRSPQHEPGRPTRAKL